MITIAWIVMGANHKPADIWVGGQSRLPIFYKRRIAKSLAVITEGAYIERVAIIKTPLPVFYLSEKSSVQKNKRHGTKPLR